MDADTQQAIQDECDRFVRSLDPEANAAPMQGMTQAAVDEHWSPEYTECRALQSYAHFERLRDQDLTFEAAMAFRDAYLYHERTALLLDRDHVVRPYPPAGWTGTELDRLRLRWRDVPAWMVLMAPPELLTPEQQAAQLEATTRDLEPYRLRGKAVAA